MDAEYIITSVYILGICLSVIFVLIDRRYGESVRFYSAINPNDTVARLVLISIAWPLSYPYGVVKSLRGRK